MTTSIDHRKAAEESLQGLVKSMEGAPQSDDVHAFLEECASLAVAIHAFHMEGIRFRMFNVDRMINKGTVTLSDGARAAFADVRRHLEAAGFHTRSHQAPT
jgi:ribose 1,5-bisphosphokinase PhnN